MSTAIDEEKKNLLKNIMVPAPEPLPGSFKAPRREIADATPQTEDQHEKQHAAEAAPAQPKNKDFRTMRAEAEKKDPVAGKIMAEEELIHRTYWISRAEAKTFKMYCAMNDHKMSDILRSAVQDYIALHNPKK